MADKFEFKRQSNLQLCSAKLNPSKKPSLLQYKQVILELSDALSELSTENEALKKQTLQLKDKNNELASLLKIQKSKNEEIVDYRVKFDQQIKSQKHSVEGYRVELAKCEEKARLLQKTNMELSEKIASYSERVRNSERLYQVSQQKIRVLQQSLQSAIEQNRHIKLQIFNKNKYNEEQLKELVEFNEQLKKKFSIIQMSIPKYAPENDLHAKMNEAMIYDYKDKRSFSTQKKAKRNIGCLSSSGNMMRRTTRHGQQAHEPHYEPIKAFSSMANPQLNEQLQNLKKEIAQQYTLIGIQNETYSKQRVSKTLEELRRRMGKAIQVAEQSQSQSCV